MHSLTHRGQAQTSVYLNDSTHNLNSSPPGPSQSEELYKRSVMLVIWYKVGPHHPTHSFINDQTGSYNAPPPLAPFAHIPLSSTLPVSLPPLVSLANTEFFCRRVQR